MFAQIGFAAEMEFGLESNNEETKGGKRFLGILDRVLTKRGLKKEDLCNDKDVVTNRILREYSSIFIVSEKVLPPHVCILRMPKKLKLFKKRRVLREKKLPER